MNPERGGVSPAEKEDRDTNDKKTSRRDFLKFAGATIAGLALGTNQAEAGISKVVTMKKEKPNWDEILDKQIIVKEQIGEDEIAVTPEYERELKRILISIPTNDYGGKKRDTGSPEKADQYLRRLYTDLLKSLPEYTEIEIILQPDDQILVEMMIKNLGIKNKITFHLVDSEIGNIEEWAQDLGEAIKVNGQEKFLKPLSLSLDDNLQATKRVKTRNQSIDQAFGSANVVPASFYFEGGNITYDKTDDGLRVFVGYNDIDNTQYYYEKNGVKKTLEEIAKMISNQFGGAEVVIMGTERQPKEIFHLDQSFIILADQQVVLNKIDDETPAAESLIIMRKQLENLGYKISNIDLSQSDLTNSFISTNAIPYVDKQTKERKIIFPVFPGEVNGNFDNLAELTPDILQGKGKQTFEIYQKLGYRPVPVRDFSHVLKGNTHCISNVLAKLEKGETDEVLA